jgi:hypothetical protein
MSQHNLKHGLVHGARLALETEAGKKATKAVATAVIAAAPPVLVAAAAPLAPFAIVGALGYCVYRALKD